MIATHIDPLGRTAPIDDDIDEICGEYAHGPTIGWVKRSSLRERERLARALAHDKFDHYSETTRAYWLRQADAAWHEGTWTPHYD